MEIISIIITIYLYLTGKKGKLNVTIKRFRPLKSNGLESKS